jgi:hypothetical protein
MERIDAAGRRRGVRHRALCAEEVGRVAVPRPAEHQIQTPAVHLRSAARLSYTPYVNSGALAGTLDFTRYNAWRVETFYAADSRVDRRFIMGRTQLIAFIDLQNFTNRQNHQAPHWNPRTRTGDKNESIGLFPSVGLNLEF